jgi:hypothetical protein
MKIRINALCGQNEELLIIIAGGTYSYCCVLKGYFLHLAKSYLNIWNNDDFASN